MKIEPSEFFPASRREGIISKESEGELLIYDCTRDQAHCLNESAAAIWKLCDGRTSVPEIARRLSAADRSGQWAGAADGRRQTADGTDDSRQQTADGGRRSSVAGQPTTDGVDERVVWLGLDELRRKHLLEACAAWPQTGIASMSRREAVRRIGLGAAIALPLVATIISPTPAQAATCKHNNAACSTGGECCSGACQAGPGGPKCLGG